jgi:hypothetical protein
LRSKSAGKDISPASARSTVRGDAIRREAGGEVTHGREENRDSLLVAPDMGHLACRFDHQHPIDAQVEAVEGEAGAVELIAENEDKLAGHAHQAGYCSEPNFGPC